MNLKEICNREKSSLVNTYIPCTQFCNNNKVKNIFRKNINQEYKPAKDYFKESYKKDES